jgi:hypothetical protein
MYRAYPQIEIKPNSPKGEPSIITANVALPPQSIPANEANATVHGTVTTSDRKSFRLLIDGSVGAITELGSLRLHIARPRNKQNKIAATTQATILTDSGPGIHAIIMATGVTDQLKTGH